MCVSGCPECLCVFLGVQSNCVSGCPECLCVFLGDQSVCVFM